MSSIFNNVRILGNLDVKGTTTSISSETVLISDNHFLLNSGYTLAAGQTGGVVVNYKAVADGVVVAGFDSTTTVNAVGLTLVTGDYIQVSGARTAANNGLYEVSSYVDPVLTIKTTGVNDFSKVAFVADTSDTVAYATHVNLAVMQTSTTGIWGVGSGSSGTMTISPLITNASNAFLLGGSADGQTAYGGKEPGANMVLRSTTHATKGSVKIDETTGSASISTGALVVGGGVGVVSQGDLAVALLHRQCACDLEEAKGIDHDVATGARQLAQAGVQIQCDLAGLGDGSGLDLQVLRGKVHQGTVGPCAVELHAHVCGGQGQAVYTRKISGGGRGLQGGPLAGGLARGEVTLGEQRQGKVHAGEREARGVFAAAIDAGKGREA